MEYKELDGQSVIKADNITEPNDFLWKQYVTFVDLFKFYLDTTLKSNIWFYTITGAILTYYFAHLNKGNANLKFSLILPVILGLGIGVIFLLGSIQAKDMKRKLTYIREELHLPGAPHADVLIIFLQFSGILSILVALFISFFYLYI